MDFYNMSNEDIKKMIQDIEKIIINKQIEVEDKQKKIQEIKE